jgi:DNA-binding SARP family transcriptional activator
MCSGKVATFGESLSLRSPEEEQWRTVKMREEDQPGHPSIPAIRIWTLGEFVVERLYFTEEQEPRYEQVAPQDWQSRGAAMTLLKVLLCHPRRRASKDASIVAIWPQSDDGAKRLKHVERALDAAASVLRSILRTSQGASLLLTRRSGNHLLYRLADQQHLWVDVDALEAPVHQAMQMEGVGIVQEVLTVWEEAYRLAQCGAFLEDDLYTPWSQARRHMVEGTRRLCVYHLADLYLAFHRLVEAEVLLRTFWTANPTDEDALYHLMKLLVQQERDQEALRLFRYAERLLEQEEGRRPSTHLITLVERLQAPGGDAD